MITLRVPKDLLEKASLQERQWLEERFSMFSEREKLLMNAAMEQAAVPGSAKDLINLSFWIGSFGLCFPAGDEGSLGLLIAREFEGCGDTALQYLHLKGLGELWKETHQGFFSRDRAYVMVPEGGCPAVYDGYGLESLKDAGYVLKLRLSSAHCRDGVWVRLPDGGEKERCTGEMQVALKSLGVSSMDECRMMESVCVLKGIRDPVKDYDSLEHLVRDVAKMGEFLEDQRKGKPRWNELFHAALALEDCHRFDFALDISQNLNCYDYMTNDDDLKELGVRMAKKDGVIHPGSLAAKYFDYTAYGRSIVERLGMMMLEKGSVQRNEREFIFRYSQEPDALEMSQQV